MKRCIVVALFSFLLSSATFAQEPATGFPRFGSFDTVGFDTVNRENLNIMFQVPVVSKPGRGLDFSFGPTYNSLVYKIQGTVWVPVVDESGNPTWGWTLKPELVENQARWQQTTETCYGPGLLIDPQTGEPYEPCDNPPSDCKAYNYTRYSNFSWRQDDGTVRRFPSIEHNLGGFFCTYDHPSSVTQGTASDGSGYEMDSTSTVNVKVYSPSGFRLDSSITDRNGNYISASTTGSTTDYIDTLGHTVFSVIEDTTNDRIHYDVLVTSYNATTGEPESDTERYTINLTEYGVQSSFGCVNGTGDYSSGTTTYLFPTSLDLPTGESFQFEYEVVTSPSSPYPTGKTVITGRLVKLTLPTCGTYEYEYGSTNAGMNCSDAGVDDVERIVTFKYSDSDSSSQVTTWAYSRSGGKTIVEYPQMPYDSTTNKSEYTFSSGLETKQEHFQNTTSMQTIDTTYGSNPTTVERTTTYHGGSTSKGKMTFDSYGNVTQVQETAIGESTPTRTTVNTYLDSSSYTDRRLYNLLAETKTYEGSATSGTPLTWTAITYDEAAYMDCDGTLGAENHSLSCSITARGNPTTIERYPDPSVPTSKIVQHYTYDDFGNVIQTDTDCCQELAVTYDSDLEYAFPSSVTKGTGSGSLTTSYEYNPFARKIHKETNPNGEVSIVEYRDVLERVTKQIRPDDEYLSIDYDDETRIVTATSPLGEINKSYLDQVGRIYRTEVSDGSKTREALRLEYDPLGRAYRTLVPKIGSMEYWTETRFDVLARPTIAVPADGWSSGSPSSYTSYSYSGLQTTITDPAGNQAKVEIGHFGQVVKQWLPDPDNSGSLDFLTEYDYDNLGRLIEITSGSQSKEFTYDSIGRLTTVETPEGGISTKVFEDFGAPSTITDSRGVTASYTYDALNRLTLVTFTEPTCSTTPCPVDEYVAAADDIEYTWGTSASIHNKGRLQKVVQGDYEESYEYNEIGQVTRVTKKIEGTTYKLAYSYNDDGKRISITYEHPDSTSTVVSYDQNVLGELTSIRNGSTTLMSVTGRNAAGQVTAASFGDGMTSSASYLEPTLALDIIKYNLSSVKKFELDYGYEVGTGKILSIDDNITAGRNVDYEYDELGRLTRAQSQGSLSYRRWDIEWDYDRYGNRTDQDVIVSPSVLHSGQYAPPESLSIAYDATTNRYAASEGYTYSDNGNIVDDGTLEYRYDSMNRLIEVRDSTTAAVVAGYTYDHGGMRTTRTFDSTTIVELREESALIAEYEDNGSGTYSVLVNQYFLSDGFQFAKSNASGSMEFYYRDHLSVRLKSEGTGPTITQMGHYPYGEPWYVPSTSTERFTFANYEREDLDDDDYAFYRIYRSETGRFTSVDPMLSMNAYSYASNDPINFWDPSGLMSDYHPRYPFHAYPYANDPSKGGSGWGYDASGFIIPSSVDAFFIANGMHWLHLPYSEVDLKDYRIAVNKLRSSNKMNIIDWTDPDTVTKIKLLSFEGYSWTQLWGRFGIVQPQPLPRDPKHNTLPDACGPGNGILEKLVCEGGKSFCWSGECKGHDDLYGDPKERLKRGFKTRKEVDQWFRGEMLNTCNGLPKDVARGCRIKANTFYVFVRLFGAAAWTP